MILASLSVDHQCKKKDGCYFPLMTKTEGYLKARVREHRVSVVSAGLYIFWIMTWNLPAEKEDAEAR